MAKWAELCNHGSMCVGGGFWKSRRLVVARPKEMVVFSLDPRNPTWGFSEFLTHSVYEDIGFCSGKLGPLSSP
jgi:hypothetical protein